MAHCSNSMPRWRLGAGEASAFRYHGDAEGSPASSPILSGQSVGWPWFRASSEADFIVSFFRRNQSKLISV
jgi:hypothetical protein